MPVHAGSLFYEEHRARYAFAQQRLRPGRTLDLACGTGFGADALAHSTRQHVVGIDTNLAAVRAAREAFPNPTVSFCVADGLKLPFGHATFQNIVSLETIEHIPDDRGFLAELARVLVADGTCVLSTPNRLYSLQRGISNPYHVREYTRPELEHLLSSYFDEVHIFYQGFSSRYESQVTRYSQEIHARKAGLGAPLRVLLDSVYRPVKHRIPTSFKNTAIRRLLRLRYPQPELTDIVISAHEEFGTSNFVTVLAAPRQAGRVPQQRLADQLTTERL